MPAILSLPALQTALEVGAIYSLVALALFISFSILHIADPVSYTHLGIRFPYSVKIYYAPAGADFQKGGKPCLLLTNWYARDASR